ncbi:MAG: adenylosuccinate lyase [Candidatus Heimdallarchaeota archaeon]|nr:adenylosuccinate lyase [Candidatus Heimdallarchaeota archaeon]
MTHKKSDCLHPINWRYGSQEMRDLFSREKRLELLLKVEAAIASAHAAVGNIPKEAAKEIENKASLEFVKLERVDEIEREISHDIASIVRAFSEQCGEYGRYIHLGATSNDIIDTAEALRTKEGLLLVQSRLKKIIQTLIPTIKEHIDTVCVGRTHGSQAVPYSFGHKLAIWLDELLRHFENINYLANYRVMGKLSGAVGTRAAYGEHADKIVKLTMEKLGLTPATITHQLLSRELIAEVFLGLILLASSLDKFATEVRNLQRTEIHEVLEPFRSGKQVGSSTMSHKRDPEKSERICSLARIMRGYATPVLENIITWHERDLANSASERYLYPVLFLTIDQMLMDFQFVISGWTIQTDQMKANLEMSKGLIMAEAVMTELAKNSMNRQNAHELLRRNSMEAIEKDVHLYEILKDDPDIKEYITPAVLKDIFENPQEYLGTAQQQIRTVLQKAEKILS